MTLHEVSILESTVHTILQQMHLPVCSTDKYGFDKYDNDHEHEV